MVATLYLSAQSAFSLCVALWAFTTIPTPIFCTSSNDPCSCKGGGFGILKPICKNTTNREVATAAATAYVSVLASIGDDVGAIMASVAVTGFVVCVFTIAFQSSSLGKAKEELAEVELRNRELERRNAEIQKELEVEGLDEEQAEIVEQGSESLEESVPACYHLSYKVIRYEERIAGGSFGDCYLGTMNNTKVAVKKMRGESRAEEWRERSERQP